MGRLMCHNDEPFDGLFDGLFDGPFDGPTNCPLVGLFEITFLF